VGKGHGERPKERSAVRLGLIDFNVYTGRTVRLVMSRLL
jgi:hypothetical protein